MTKEKVSIENRHGLKLVIQVDTPDNPTNLVFIAHGQGGSMVQIHIQAFGKAFFENDYRVVYFDATHALGESEGELIDVTYDNYVEDLEDVINWARSQDWFQQPFALCGQSMGAQSTAWYAEHHPSEVKLIAPIAPTVNFDLWVSTMDSEYREQWEERGYKEELSRTLGVLKQVGWGVAESLKKFDLLPGANKLTMPVLFMAGEFDQPCPIENQMKLYELIPSKNKKFVKISGAEHSFRNNKTQEYGKEVQEAKAALSSWLRGTDNLTS
jgi:pimeloyl-ACP methyl ester carboxylesterase